MQTIINYMAEEFIKKLTETRNELYKNPKNLAEFVIATRKETDELARRFIQEVVQEMDDIIYQHPSRKKNWYVEQKDNKKKLLTSVGEIVYSKTLYVSKDKGGEEGTNTYCYLLDKFLGLEPNQTMTEDVKANIYQEAVQTSYRKGGEMACPEGVTKGTVKNVLHQIKFPGNFQIPEVKKVVDYLYIDADEDHYHLQFQNKKGDLVVNEKGRKCNGAINKIIYVFEDIVPEAPKSKRNKLVNPHYFCRGTEQDNKSLWKEVFAYIEATYDLEKVKRIYINSDGGQWIKSGHYGFANTMFVLDEFHLSQSFVRLTRHMKDSSEDAIDELRNCIRRKNKTDFYDVIERIKACTESEKTLAIIDKEAAYIASNWTAAKYRLARKEGVKSCSAEGHVYHVLSSRMSTQAMGWSRHGGSQMARLREYYYNDGDMLELAKYQKEDLPMAAGAEEIILSASSVLEKRRKTKTETEYGKYSERIRHTLSLQSNKRLWFYLNGKL